MRTPNVLLNERFTSPIIPSMKSDLLQKPLLILDGGLGTSLEDEYGIRFSSNETPLWSSDLLVRNPTTLSRLQQDFAYAGAEIILTATYQASFHGFASTRLEKHANGIEKEDASQYMLSAVHVARSAFEGRPGLVALSLGAYGATTIPSAEYSGEYGAFTLADLQRFHRERLSVFLNSYEWQDVDLLAFETLPRLDEVKAVRKVIGDLLETKPYWITCVFPSADNDALPDGTSIVQVVAAMLEGEKAPFAIGFNCTKVSKAAHLIQQFESAIEELKLPFPRLVLYPDGAHDLVYNTTLQTWENLDASGSVQPWHELMLDVIQDVQSRGRWSGIIAGGCCKTTPAHIRALKDGLMQSESQAP